MKVETIHGTRIYKFGDGTTYFFRRGFSIREGKVNNLHISWGLPSRVPRREFYIYFCVGACGWMLRWHNRPKSQVSRGLQRITYA